MSWKRIFNFKESSISLIKKLYPKTKITYGYKEFDEYTSFIIKYCVSWIDPAGVKNFFIIFPTYFVFNYASLECTRFIISNVKKKNTTYCGPMTFKWLILLMNLVVILFYFVGHALYYLLSAFDKCFIKQISFILYLKYCELIIQYCDALSYV